MSLFVMKVREILCDHPGCDMCDSDVGGADSAADLRATLAGQGWRRKGHKDFCPRHAEDADV